MRSDEAKIYIYIVETQYAWKFIFMIDRQNLDFHSLLYLKYTAARNSRPNKVFGVINAFSLNKLKKQLHAFEGIVL